jgi:signal transduction histidine kinase
MNRRWLPARSEVLLAAAVLVMAAVELAANPAIQPRGAAVPLEILLAITLAWRRQFPLAVVVAVATIATIETVAGVPLEQPVVPLIAAVIATFTVAAHRPLRPAAAGVVVMIAAIGIQSLAQHKGLGNFIFGLIFVCGAWVTSRLVYSRTRENVALQAQTSRLAEERDVSAAQAAAAERGRIARELHDVIAHSLSVMVVQAGAAEHVIAREPARAGEAMRAVQDTGRQALSEMAHLLGILREDGEELGFVPQPGISDLPALVAQARNAGLPVELRIEGERHTVPTGVELSLFRIVQEALTNVRKHAGPAHTTVLLRYGPGAIETVISDDGNGSSNGFGGGHGLVGMRERANLYGGALQAEPGPSGGFVVRVSMPTETIG